MRENLPFENPLFADVRIKKLNSRVFSFSESFGKISESAPEGRSIFCNFRKLSEKESDFRKNAETFRIFRKVAEIFGK